MDKALIKIGISRDQVHSATAQWRAKEHRTPKTNASGIGTLIRDIQVGQRVLFPIASDQSTRRHAAIAFQRAKERKMKIKTKATPNGLEIERVR